MKQDINIIAKISPPRLHSVFNRTRLFDLITHCRRHPVTWISGLPGSGKTTLAASYIESNKISTLWYQIDRTDNDPANFFYYITEAVKKENHLRKTTLPRLSSEHLMNLPCYSIQYFRELFRFIKKPFVIVLDDYHELSLDSELHGLLSTGLEQVPPGLNIIVLSRTTPPPAMTRLLANKKVVTIQAVELSLTADEAIGIAGLHEKWESALESVPLLLEYTEGWTAGFVLMLEYNHPGDETNFKQKVMAREFFFNYFAGEIFNKMEPDTQSFLLRMACMASFTPDEAKELTGFAGAGHILAEMNRKNSFVEKKVQKSIAYKFHPLFAEFLFSRAEERLSPEELVKLYRKAAGILVDHGQPEDAFLLYARSKDYTAQANLIREYAQSFIAQGRLKVVEEWLRDLPPKILHSDPWLIFWYGQCRLPFDPRESRYFSIQAYDCFKEQVDITGLILSVSSTIETILIEWGDFKQLDPWIAKLDNLIKGQQKFSSGEIEARAIFAMFSALMFRQPHHPDLKRWERRMFKLLRSDLDNNLRLMVGGYLSHYFSWIGDIFQAEVVIDIMVELVKIGNLSPLSIMTVKMQEAVYRWHATDYAGCMEAMNQGLAEAEKSGVHLIDNWLLAQGVYAMLSIDDCEKAAALLDRMKPIINSRRYLDISHFYYLSSMYHLQQDERELALKRIEESLQYIRDMGAPFPEGLTAITAAQIYFETGDERKAEDFNIRAREIGRGMESHLLTMLSYLNEAYFSLKTGRHDRTGNALRTALAIQKDRGMINFAGWRSQFMTELYAEALKSGIEVDFIRDIIRRRDMHPEISPLEIENWPWRIKIYTLGRFETIIDGTPLHFTGKPPLKPLELLKVLVALGGKRVGLSRLEALLWPEADGDRARQALVTTLHRLRKLIGYEKALELSEMKLSLSDRYCWVDVWAFEELYNKIAKSLADGGFDENKTSHHTDMMLTLYRGDFLKNEDECTWTWPTLTRLRSRFLHAIGVLARGWERQGTFEKAVDLYLRGLAVDETAEELYQGLMKCYQAQGRTAEGLSVYKRCREALASALQVAPSPETESIHHALRQGKIKG